MVDERTKTERHPGPHEAAAARMALYVAHGPAVGRARVVIAPVVLGRGGDAFGEGGIDDDRVSREHAEIRPSRGKLSVEDRGSHNGTWVNGRRVESATLEPGDVLRVGGVTLVAQRVYEDGVAPDAPGLVGVSQALGEVVAQLRLAATRPVTVTLVGETGVGKERLARALHQLSGRRGAFVAMNCGGLADGVLQSELFGHARGAFSGASEARRGLVREAEGGTLLLDEIGEAPQRLQTTLLRLLEEGEVRPVGGDRARPVDVRFVAATHQELADAVEDGRFRRDLMMRLYRWVVRIPPLRDRPEDIGPLVHHFGGGDALTDELWVRLLRYAWPGNVRELQAIVERLALEASSRGLSRAPAWLDQVLAEPEPDATDKHERPSPERLRELLKSTGGNVRRLAGELGVSRRSVYRWLADAGIDPADVRAED